MYSFLKDQLGVPFEFEKPFQRIVSLVPSQTELLVDLGLEESIVGITKFCIHPMHLKHSKTIVGGTKKVNFDKIKNLNPDIIICNKEENTKEIVERLRTISPVWVTDVVTIEDNLQMISDFGQLFHKQLEAQHWIVKISIAQQDFQEFIKNKSIKKTAYFIWANPFMVVGSATFINELLKLNKFQNYYENQSRYPQIEIEKSYTNLDLELILLSSEPYPFKEKDTKEMELFYPKAKVVLVDGEMFSWYGSRLVKAFDYFKEVHNQL